MYFEPEMKVVLVETTDVIRTSGTNGGGANAGDTLPDDEF